MCRHVRSADEQGLWGEMGPKWVFQMLVAWMLACAGLMLYRARSILVRHGTAERCKVEVLSQCGQQNEWLYENEEDRWPCLSVVGEDGESLTCSMSAVAAP